MDTTVKVKIDTTEAERALGRLNNAITALGAAFAGGAITDFIDSTTNLTNKLRLVTASSTELVKVQNKIMQLSGETGAEVNAMASLYSRLSGAQDAAGLTGEGVMRMTELIGKSLATAGLTVQETSSVMLQLSQAFNSGRLQGDEFRSIAEAYPPLLKMVAKEMGVTTGELKRLGSEGKITGVILRDAFLNNANQIEENFSKMSRTLGQELNYIKIQAMKAFLEFDKATGFSDALAGALRTLGDNIGAVTNAAAAFLAVLAVQRIAAITVAVYELAAAGKLLDTILNGLGKGSWIAILISALVFIGTKIYDAMIKPMTDFGIKAGVVARFMVQSYVNGFLNVAEAAISLFPAIAKIIADSLTPGKDMSESLREIGTIMKGIMKQERLQLVNEAELKQIRDYHKEVNKVGQEAKKTGQYTKEAQVGISEQAHKASIAFQDTIFKMKIANDSERSRLLYGERYAATQRIIAEETEKLRKAGLTMTAQMERDVASLVKQQFALKDMATTRQTLVGLADQITVLSERQASEQEVINGLLQYQRSVSAETYEINKGIVNQYLRKIQSMKDMSTYNLALFEIDQERRILETHSLKDREIAIQLQQYQTKVSKDMYEATKDRVAEELSINRELRIRREIQDEINLLQNFQMNSSIKIDKFRNIENDLLGRAVKQEQMGLAAEHEKLRALLKHKQLREEISQLLDAEKYLTAGANAEMLKMRDNIDVISFGIDHTVKRIQHFRDVAKSLGVDESLMMDLTKEKETLTALEKLRLKYEQEQQKTIFRIRGENSKAIVLEQDQEMMGLLELHNQKLIAEEDLYKGISQIRKKYMYEIQQAAIQEMLVEQGIRTNIMGREVQLMSVNKDTAEQIARDRVAFEKKTEYDKTQFFIQQGATVFDALGKQNKEAFKAAQALNIAMALMNTYRAASVALATYPWPFSLVAVAAAVATGLAQVAAIRSQSYSGRALGGGVMGGSSYIVGERGPELFTPTNSGKITRNQDLGAGGGTTVNFTVVANDTRGFDELLTARKGLITQIIQDAQLEKGRRI